MSHLDPSNAAVQGDRPTHESSKRRQSTNVRMSYPRKRAITACSLCRMRKTKCDNQRPSCGTCASISVTCSYQDSTNTDLSSFDPASLAILERVNTAIQLLQKQAHLPNLVESLATLQRAGLPYQTGESPGAVSNLIAPPMSLPSDAFSPTRFPEESATRLEEALEGSGSCYPVLQWPIFEDRFSDTLLDAMYFNQGNEPGVRVGSASGFAGVREDDAPELTHHFLRYVHNKNPILDPPTLVTAAKEIAEHGFKWDAKSCTILIVCALAKLAIPFSLVEPERSDSSVLDTEEYCTAEAYYLAARKRVGLLDVSIVAVQSIFLLGVYQMYSMRPLQAWVSFNQACMLFQTHLRGRAGQEADRATRRLEQRLYWTCLKSECEMRDEVSLAPSGLANFNHPDLFPSPPGNTPDPDAGHTTDGSSDIPTPVTADIEKSWYYYLSEIASRRLKNRICAVLHKNSPYIWQAASAPKLQRLAGELDGQVQRWAEHIPGFMGHRNQDATDELTYMLVGRYLDLQLLICRPFLYLMVHADYPNQHDPVTRAFAERAISLLIEQLLHMTIKHRHHGTWYLGRQLFSQTLMLLAAVKSQRVPVPGDWRDAFQKVMAFQRYWECEAPDLGEARQILLRIYQSITVTADIHPISVS